MITHVLGSPNSAIVQFSQNDRANIAIVLLDEFPQAPGTPPETDPPLQRKQLFCFTASQPCAHPHQVNRRKKKKNTYLSSFPSSPTQEPTIDSNITDSIPTPTIRTTSSLIDGSKVYEIQS